jgi:hypothetical protein
VSETDAHIAEGADAHRKLIASLISNFRITKFERLIEALFVDPDIAG